jgi:hypothetical protein
MGKLARALVLVFVSAALVPMVGGCGPLGKVEALATDPAVGALAAKVKTLVDGLGLLNTALDVPLPDGTVVPTGTLTKVKGWLADLGKLATDISTTTSLATAKPLVTQVGVIVDDVLAALPKGALPANVLSLASATTTYLPLIEDLVGIVGARHPGAARSFGGMSPSDAERVLVAAAATAAVRRQ